MVIAVFSQPLSRILVRHDPPDFSREVAILDSLEVVYLKSNDPGDENRETWQPFVFDPNRATAVELELLGIPGNLARRIVNYREKGGSFRQKSDLLKIYGLDTTTFKRLYAFIDLPAVASGRRRVAAESGRITERPERQVVSIEPHFDLNEADTAILKQIRGIGPVLADRIVRYRAKLGGFVIGDQLHEVYRLDTAVVQALLNAAYIREDFIPRTIALNTANEYEMAGHPYVGKILAKAIVAYRYQHGPFGNVEDIRRIHHVDDSVFRRVLPYLSID